MKILSAILLFVLVSCSKRIDFIYYSYNGVTITRLNKDNETYLYYGKFNDLDSLPETYIKSTYNGFDGIMDAYLIINSDKSVEIVPIADVFELIKPTNDFKIKKFRSNVDFINWEEKIKGKYKNIIRLSNIIDIEIKRNADNSSDIMAVY